MSLTDAGPRVDRAVLSGRRVLAAQILLVALIVTSLPLAGFAVFVLGSDRNASGDAVSVVFFLALVALLASPWWPTARSSARTRWERLQSTVLNGIIGFSALWLRHRSRRRSAVAIHLLMATAVVHLYSTFMYFSTEILEGYPNVDTTSFVDLYVKFLLLNGLWLVVPWLVLLWGHRTVRALPAESDVGGDAMARPSGAPRQRRA